MSIDELTAKEVRVGSPILIIIPEVKKKIMWFQSVMAILNGSSSLSRYDYYQDKQTSLKMPTQVGSKLPPYDGDFLRVSHPGCVCIQRDDSSTICVGKPPKASNTKTEKNHFFLEIRWLIPDHDCGPFSKMIRNPSFSTCLQIKKLCERIHLWFTQLRKHRHKKEQGGQMDETGMQKSPSTEMRT